MMEFSEFVDLVASMRSAQTDYFKGRKPADLSRSKSLEAKVDKAIGDLRCGQRSLFDPSGGAMTTDEMRRARDDAD